MGVKYESINKWGADKIFSTKLITVCIYIFNGRIDFN